MCFETVTYCSIVTPTFSGYRGEIYNYAYYGNPLGGSEAFMGSSDSIGNTIAIIDKETIPGIHIHDVKFRFRMGGVYMETSSSWTIYNFSLYSSGKEIEGDKITIPESTFIADDFSIAVNYTNNGTEDIDFAYLQASMYNLQNGINLVSHKPITNLKMGDSVNVTFDYKADINLFLYFESFSNMTIFEIEVKVLNRSSEYSNYIVDSCTVDEFTISPNRNYIYHPNDDMSFYCSDKMVPYDDLILDNNILKTEISLLNKPPTISLLEESETLLKNQNYTFVQLSLIHI